MKIIFRYLILSCLLFASQGVFAEQSASQQGIFVNDESNQAPVSNPGPLNDPSNPPDPNAPIDSNLYVLFFAALCYGVYQRKRLSSLVVRG